MSYTAESPTPCQNCSSTEQGHLEFAGGKEIEICNECYYPKTVRGALQKALERIKALEESIEQHNTRLLSVRCSVEHTLPGVFTLNRVLANGTIVKVSKQQGIASDSYYRLKPSGVLEFFFGEGWTPSSITVDGLIQGVLSNEYSWEPSSDSMIEIALLKVDDL